MNIARLFILLTKERRQLFREPFSLVVGILLPMLMLLLLGYAMTTDVKDIKLAIVVPETSEEASEITARFRASKFFITHLYASTSEGTEAVRNHTADACLYLPADLPRKIGTGEAQFLVTLNATNASQAMLKENYIRGILAGGAENSNLSVKVESRIWFNDANDSRYFMIPGVIVIIMTLIGTMLTSMLMAQEYEHGNLESMFVTPMTSTEILLAKAVNNFVLGMVGLGITLIASRYIFHVPIRGSVSILILGSAIYLLLSLALGLVISSVAKNQFVASQLTLVTTFLPTFTLSGFLFEIHNMPVVLRWISLLVPARYFVDFLQTIFLVGNVWPNIVQNLTILSGITVFLMVLAKQLNPKTLEVW